MGLRDDLFRKNGPLLTEAFMLLLLEEFNRIRTQIGMPLITKQDVLFELNAHLENLDAYDWMTKET